MQKSTYALWAPLWLETEQLQRLSVSMNVKIMNFLLHKSGLSFHVYIKWHSMLNLGQFWFGWRQIESKISVFKDKKYEATQLILQCYYCLCWTWVPTTAAINIYNLQPVVNKMRFSIFCFDSNTECYFYCRSLTSFACFFSSYVSASDTQILGAVVCVRFIALNMWRLRQMCSHLNKHCFEY